MCERSRVAAGNVSYGALYTCRVREMREACLVSIVVVAIIYMYTNDDDSFFIPLRVEQISHRSG